jgi:hypothetical protein
MQTPDISISSILLFPGSIFRDTVEFVIGWNFVQKRLGRFKFKGVYREIITITDYITAHQKTRRRHLPGNGLYRVCPSAWYQNVIWEVSWCESFHWRGELRGCQWKHLIFEPFGKAIGLRNLLIGRFMGIKPMNV